VSQQSPREQDFHSQILGLTRASNANFIGIYRKDLAMVKRIALVVATAMTFASMVTTPMVAHATAPDPVVAPTPAPAVEECTITGTPRSEIELAESSAGSLGRFVRSLVGLERSAVEKAFAGLLNRQTFGVNQIRFLELVVDELTRNGSMDPGRLYESPFTDFSPAGPDQIFAGTDITAILNLVDNLNNSAEVSAA
jgi:type I site-specific restriction endonuclease